MDTELKAKNGTKLSAIQVAYIEWCATGRVWPKTWDEPRAVNHVEFCELTKVPRRTTYNWEKDIPGFWDMVEDFRVTELNRKVTQYYEWAEIAARPVVKKNPITGKTELVRAGNIDAIKLLLGQGGRKAADKQEILQEVHNIDSSLSE
jgi:hypothetical protein